MASPSAQLAAETFAAGNGDETRSEAAQTTSSTGVKRKRGTELKFYAVRTGHAPGIYHSWADCKAQVTGFKKATFKSFTSLTEAEAFMKADGSNPSPMLGTPVKFYAIQNGRVPGVYTDWPSAQKQITGWTKPKHKSFSTRAEAEAFVFAQKADGVANPNVLIDPDDPTASSAYAADSAPVAKKPKVARKETPTPAPLTEQELLASMTGEPLLAPLPADAEDGFDRRVIMDLDSGKIRWKTEEELSATKMVSKTDNYADSLHIWTDGSCRGNGQKGAVAGVGVHFGKNDPRNVSEGLKGERQTNQRAELTAVKRALDICPVDRNAIIFSDSSYSINCVTTWFKSWRRNGWMTASKKPVDNKDLVEEIIRKIEERELCGTQTNFVWLKGHADDPGNIAADKLAVDGAEKARMSRANGFLVT